MYICVCTNTYTYTSTQCVIYIYIYIYIHTHTYTMYIYIYIYIYMHIHIHEVTWLSYMKVLTVLSTSHTGTPRPGDARWRNERRVPTGFHFSVAVSEVLSLSQWILLEIASRHSLGLSNGMPLLWFLVCNRFPMAERWAAEYLRVEHWKPFGGTQTNQYINKYINQ